MIILYLFWVLFNFSIVTFFCFSSSCLNFSFIPLKVVVFIHLNFLYFKLIYFNILGTQMFLDFFSDIGFVLHHLISILFLAFKYYILLCNYFFNKRHFRYIRTISLHIIENVLIWMFTLTNLFILWMWRLLKCKLTFIIVC